MGLSSRKVLPKALKVLQEVATSLEEALSLKGPLGRDQHHPHLAPLSPSITLFWSPQDISFHISSLPMTC